MSPGLSASLNAWRAGAALVVVISHWAYPRFTNGDWSWVRAHDLGGDAVAVFFVLSGLMIARAADLKRAAGAAGFAFDRATRIASVAVPAALLTLVADALGAGLNPALYEGWWMADGAQGWRALAALTFTQEVWWVDVRFGTNGPWWSLSYEVWFYALFAAAAFAPRALRWPLVAAIALIMGPAMLALLPAWLAGVWTWRALQRGAHTRMTRPLALALTWGPVALCLVAHAQNIPATLYAATFDALGADAMARLGFSDTALWHSVLAGLVAAHILGLAALMQDAQRPRWAFAAHWLAGGSFALYLAHYPLLHLMAALTGHDPASTADQWSLLALTVLACLAFAEVSDRRVGWLRAVLRRPAARRQAA